MTNEELALRTELVEACRALNQSGLSKGTTGNISVRHGDGFLISPTGVPYPKLAPEQVVAVNWDGTCAGDILPSSEWRFHRDLLAARPELNAVVHTHSTHATALAVLGKDIPAIHYGIAAAGGSTIRCAPYEMFGTQALADRVVQAMEGRRACLLAHHGMIAAHVSLARAFSLAVTVEELSQVYLLCLRVGEPPVLSEEQIGDVLARYKTYGQQTVAASTAQRVAV